MAVLTDPAECGPVTLSFCQDVQTEAYDYPERFFAPRMRRTRRPRPIRSSSRKRRAALQGARKPVIVAGGGVLYAAAERDLAAFAERHGMPVVETQAGKSTLPDDHSACPGRGRRDRDRRRERPRGRRRRAARGRHPARRLHHRVGGPDRPVAGPDRHAQRPASTPASTAPFPWWPTPPWGLGRSPGRSAATGARELDGPHGGGEGRWADTAATYTGPTNLERPSDAQVIGAVQRVGRASDVVVCAAGGLPGELHKLWKSGDALGYHLEYGYSCMGYEIAGGLGVKMALPHREVIVMVGDGSYLMMNSEIATSVMLGLKLTIVLLDNGGYGCINRLQQACGGAPFNNLLADTRHVTLPAIDFVAHARSLGAEAQKVAKRGRARGGARGEPRRGRDPGHPDRHRCRTFDRRGWGLVGCRGAGRFAPPRGEGRVRRLRGEARPPTRRQLRRRRSMAIRIGANPIGWSNDDLIEIGGETPLETCLAEARAAGIEGMELGHKFPREAPALQAALAALRHRLHRGLVLDRAAAPLAGRGVRGGPRPPGPPQGDGRQRLHRLPRAPTPSTVIVPRPCRPAP